MAELERVRHAAVFVRVGGDVQRRGAGLVAGARVEEGEQLLDLIGVGGRPEVLDGSFDGTAAGEDVGG